MVELSLRSEYCALLRQGRLPSHRSSRHDDLLKQAALHEGANNAGAPSATSKGERALRPLGGRSNGDGGGRPRGGMVMLELASSCCTRPLGLAAGMSKGEGPGARPDAPSIWCADVV